MMSVTEVGTNGRMIRVSSGVGHTQNEDAFRYGVANV
jgi:hypothetical protein